MLGKPSLRLGVMCAVFDADGAVLLSKRGDFDVWNLPTGRLDPNESIIDAAVREVREETGVEIQIDRAIGLYYIEGWQRMNILFTATLIGGELVQETHETSANQFFVPTNLPENTFRSFLVQDALTNKTLIRSISTPPQVLRRVKRQLAMRWVKNLLAGRPEPRYPQFDVDALLIVTNETRSNVLVEKQDNTIRFPRSCCTGDVPPYESVLQLLRDKFSFVPQDQIQWVGLLQTIATDSFIFVFLMSISELESSNISSLDWYDTKTVQLNAIDTLCLERTFTAHHESDVWVDINELQEGVDGYR